MMADNPRARLEELRGRKRYEELKTKQAGGGPQPDEDVGGVGNFAKSMVSGSSIGENLPFVGEGIANVGTAIGSGIQAATEAPFSDASISDLYKRNMALSQKAGDERAAIDRRSPEAQKLKAALAGLAVAPMKAAGPAAAAIKAEAPIAAEAVAETAKAVPKGGGGWLSGSSTAGKEVAEAALPKAAPKGWLSGTSGASSPAAQEKIKESLLKKYGPAVLEQAEEMLPYPARAALKGYRRFKGSVRGD